MSIEQRLQALNITLPPVAKPAAAYVPFVQTGSLVFISGHIARRDGKPWVGQLGRTMTSAEGQLAAVCAVRPIKKAYVYSRTPEKREAFCRAVSARLGIATGMISPPPPGVTFGDPAFRRKLARDGANAEVEGAIESLELAFKMQTEMPAVMNLDRESEATKKLYGIGTETNLVTLVEAGSTVELPEAATGHTHYRALFLGACCLFFLTFLINTLAEMLRQRLRERYKVV